ncbi:hypothetical protein V8E53_000335 [Lactarius tabidus]
MMDAVLVLSNEQCAARTKRLCTSTVAEHFQLPLAMSDVCPGNDALQTSVCVACARRFWSRDAELVRLNGLKDNQQLVPTHSHPAHVLMDGMLLHLTSVYFHTDVKVSHSFPFATPACLTCAETKPLHFPSRMECGSEKYHWS